MEWAFSPMTTVSSGAPNSPSACTSQPACASCRSRAAVRAAVLAMAAPVTNTAALPAGRPRSSVSHRVTTSCRRAATGDMTGSAVFWSQAAASQFAPSATGCEPPVTNPK